MRPNGSFLARREPVSPGGATRTHHFKPGGTGVSMATCRGGSVRSWGRRARPPEQAASCSPSRRRRASSAPTDSGRQSRLVRVRSMRGVRACRYVDLKLAHQPQQIGPLKSQGFGRARAVATRLGQCRFDEPALEFRDRAVKAHRRPRRHRCRGGQGLRWSRETVPRRRVLSSRDCAHGDHGNAKRMPPMRRTPIQQDARARLIVLHECGGTRARPVPPFLGKSRVSDCRISERWPEH